MIIRPGYAEDIRKHHFWGVAELLRNGDLAALDQNARNLLADYLLGNLKRERGAPRKDEALEAEYLFAECESMMKYGMMRSDFSTYWQENATAENCKDILKPRKIMRGPRPCTS